ncbi:MAG: prepilin-type N-terminal cleavage/methylation domain-containing protein [Lentisphaerae bacterium]|nr:prepilin-type N-terminal cleavage/methylation domain-containing protein [Lentisphaerota bacterium]
MRTLQNRTGFTLVEILVVVVIIGILSGIVLKLHTLVGERTARAQTLVQLENIKLCLEEFYREEGYYPPEAEERPGDSPDSAPIYHGTECDGFRKSALDQFPPNWTDILKDYPEYAESQYTGLVYYIAADTNLVLAGRETKRKRWDEYFSGGVGFNDWSLLPGTVSIPGFSASFTNVKFRLLDSWDQQFVYKCPGPDHQTYELYSKGVDGASGSPDDIGRVGLGE